MSEQTPVTPTPAPAAAAPVAPPTPAPERNEMRARQQGTELHSFGSAPQISSDQGVVQSGPFTHSQELEMIAYAEKQKSITPEQASQYRADLGVGPSPPVHQTKEALKQHGFEPAKPGDYDLPLIAGNWNQGNNDQLVAIDSARRNWLSDAHFPKGIGSALGQEIDRVSQKYQKWNSATSPNQKTAFEREKTSYERAEQATLLQVLGPKANERIKLGAKLVNELEAKHKGVKEFLEKSGAHKSAFSQIQIILHAERLFEIAKAGSKK